MIISIIETTAQIILKSMEMLWIVLFIISILFSYNLKLILSKLITKPLHLPPGPPSIPLITPLLWLTKTPPDIVRTLKALRSKHGPIITLNIASTTSIFISDHKLAHQALIHHGPAFSDRLPSTELERILSSDRHTVNSSPYGPLWRSLRRNLTSHVLHPSTVKHFSTARSWVLTILRQKIRDEANSNNGVVVPMESFQFSMFCLLVLMCFGRKLDVDQIKEIENLQAFLHKNISKFHVFGFLPTITKIVYRERWRLLLKIRREQESLFVPLMRRDGEKEEANREFVNCSYVDSLHEVIIPNEEGGGGRGLTEGEMVSLCSEFMGAGTDTTATALEWIMGEMVENEEVQRKMAKEIEEVVGEGEEIKEEDLGKMEYVKAVVLEGLRLHPPAHFLVPHVVMEDVELGGYVVPKGASVNFMVAEMGRDGGVWEDALKFRPERFVKGGEGEGVDVTGRREMKMMPFGAGRRVCPGLGIGMLHLEYFTACLVREFEWKKVEGEEVDFEEKLEVMTVMKNRLRAQVVPRRKKLVVLQAKLR